MPEEDSGELGVHESGGITDEVAVPDGERHPDEEQWPRQLFHIFE